MSDLREHLQRMGQAAHRRDGRARRLTRVNDQIAKLEAERKTIELELRHLEAEVAESTSAAEAFVRAKEGKAPK